MNSDAVKNSASRVMNDTSLTVMEKLLIAKAVHETAELISKFAKGPRDMLLTKHILAVLVELFQESEQECR